MAQSATKERAVTGIEPFRQRPTLGPSLRWERRKFILKLAILARRNFGRHPTRSTTRKINTTSQTHL